MNNELTSKTWYVYILECSDNTHYEGYTQDLEERMRRHEKDNNNCNKYINFLIPGYPIIFYQKINKYAVLKDNQE